MPHSNLVSFFIGLAFLCAHPAAAAPDDRLPNSLISASPNKSITLPTGIQVTSIETGGIYHLILPDSQGKATTSSIGRNIVSGNLKKMLNEPFSPTRVRAFSFEPEGLPPTVSTPSTSTNVFSWSQLTSNYLDKYVIPQSIKKLIPKMPNLNF